MTEIILPWPPKDLNPNARAHWSKKSKAAKSYREACRVLTLQAKPALPNSYRLALWLTFYPPDRRSRDDDNLTAAFKSGRDGIADALGIDDKRFVCMPFLHTEIGGMVKVRITEVPDEIAKATEKETA